MYCSYECVYICVLHCIYEWMNVCMKNVILVLNNMTHCNISPVYVYVCMHCLYLRICMNVCTACIFVRMYILRVYVHRYMFRMHTYMFCKYTVWIYASMCMYSLYLWSSVCIYVCECVFVCHCTNTFIYSPADARYWPSGDTVSERTAPTWPENTEQRVLGKGFSSFGRGSCGIRVCGSMFSRRFILRGHRYKSYKG